MAIYGLPSWPLACLIEFPKRTAPWRALGLLVCRVAKRQHGTFGMPDDMIDHTAKQSALDAATTTRADSDEIAALFGGDTQDGDAWILENADFGSCTNRMPSRHVLKVAFQGEYLAGVRCWECDASHIDRERNHVQQYELRAAIAKSLAVTSSAYSLRSLKSIGTRILRPIAVCLHSVLVAAPVRRRRHVQRSHIGAK